MWYAHTLFVLSLVLVLIRKIDKHQKLDCILEKINLSVLVLMCVVVWGSSHILNTPVVVVYRWGIYLLMFLLGYYVFSNDIIIDKLEKIAIPLGCITLAMGIIFTIVNYGANFGASEFLTSLFTNVYLWFVILSAFGIGKRFLNFENRFTRYMNQNNFSFYVLHYPIQIAISFALVECVKADYFICNYIGLIVGTIVVLPIVTEIVKRIPVLNRLVLGNCKKV